MSNTTNEERWKHSILRYRWVRVFFTLFVLPLAFPHIMVSVFFKVLPHLWAVWCEDVWGTRRD